MCSAITWRCGVAVLSVLACVHLEVSAMPQGRVRFPDQPSDRQSSDDATIFLRGPPQRFNFARALVNPLVNTIPREPLTLADPDQFLNAWQFYFPPGPPPAVGGGQEDFDAEGSDDLSITESPVHSGVVQPSEVTDAGESAVILENHRAHPVPINLSPIVTHLSASDVKPKPAEVEEKEVNVSTEQVKTEDTSEQKIDVPKSEASEALNVQEAIISPQQTADVAPKEVVSTEATASQQVSTEAPKQLAALDADTSSSNVKDEVKVQPKTPPNFSPRFEDGGWTPLEIVPGLL